jgi:hypothetical protein
LAIKSQALRSLWRLAGRLDGRWNPEAIDWMVLVWGVGAGGVSNKVVYLTADLGLLFGTNGHKAIDVYGGPWLAGSFPVKQPRPWVLGGSATVHDWVPVTGYLAALLGASVRIWGPLRLGLEGSFGGLVTQLGLSTWYWSGTFGFRVQGGQMPPK